MKIIKYILCTTVNRGTDDAPLFEDIFTNIERGWSEESEDIAKVDAYNGEYTIEDDGFEEEPTQLDRVESQIAYLAMMTGNEEILEV